MSKATKRPVVLVVEDEPLIREMAALMVEDAGYTALEAQHADEALAILGIRKDVGAVFTDINMSGSMDGWKLARAIRERWPFIHLIMTSGLSVPDDKNLPEKARFLPKPYTIDQLATALRAVFGSRLKMGDDGYGHHHDYRTIN